MTKKRQFETLIATPHTFETAVKVCGRIADAWSLDDAEKSELLGITTQTIPENSDETLERLSHILGIYKNLRLIFPTEEQANGWVRRPNKAFGEKPALDVMMIDPAIVRRYLDAQLV